LVGKEGGDRYNSNGGDFNRHGVSNDREENNREEARGKEREGGTQGGDITLTM